jgi:hypothetical protein
MFVIAVATTWLLMWAVMLGPLRTLTPRYHLDGMELAARPARSRRAAAPTGAPGTVDAAPRDPELAAS